MTVWFRTETLGPDGLDLYPSSTHYLLCNLRQVPDFPLIKWIE